MRELKRDEIMATVTAQIARGEMPSLELHRDKGHLSCKVNEIEVSFEVFEEVRQMVVK